MLSKKETRYARIKQLKRILAMFVVFLIILIVLGSPLKPFLVMGSIIAIDVVLLLVLGK